MFITLMKERFWKATGNMTAQTTCQKQRPEGSRSSLCLTPFAGRGVRWIFFDHLIRAQWRRYSMPPQACDFAWVCPWC